jgi:NAD(P) transhydrogenase subunit beta
MSDVASTPVWIQLAYLAASVMFILGLKGLSSPRTARSGNLTAAAGMAIAVVATLFVPGVRVSPTLIAALALGLVAGLWPARTVPITDMPQMVAFLNGLGGGAAALVATAEFARRFTYSNPIAEILGERFGGSTPPVPEMFGAVIGAISFSGSAIAFAKLQGLISERATTAGIVRVANFALAALIAVAVVGVLNGGHMPWFLLLVFAALAFGALMVVPIGGADMPVVISLLNSFTGLAAASTGFVLHNNALIIAGTLVGASGTLLTQLMCKAMNRSLGNVLFGGFGAAPAAATGGRAAAARPVREISSEDAAVLLANIRSLIIVPGYGMAVAQAQHAVRDLADLLMKRGVDVKYAIHPVAGRMPGHMNVLLAEANVPYPQLYDLEQINPDFERADVALVIGANDVVNPSARTDTASPIYGMPILDADKAQHVIIIKRSMSPGFAGIDNPLYYEPRTMMLFGDAKGVVGKLVEALRAEAA